MIQWRTYIQPPRQGTSHKKCGNSPCQDKAVIKENDSVIAAVLSDGLGQLKYSQMAADAITESVSTYLLEYDYRKSKHINFKEDILAECKRVVQECSDSSKISISEMDCTLLFVVLIKDRSHFIFGQLGDGAICVVKPNQGSQIIGLDDKLKATSNLTKTVLSKDAQEYFSLHACSANDYMGVFLTTDGLENELYSKAGKVKQKAEWYFNLISNKDDSVCFREIEKRWDELTSDEKYGFADDMSLIAIVKQNTKIKLPEDANWLCVCGKRNHLESTRCERCRKDFLKIYKGINFKEEGGSKLAFFTRINGHPKEELHILKEHSEYQIEFSIQKQGERREGKLPYVEASLDDQTAICIQSQNTTISRQNPRADNHEKHDTNDNVTTHDQDSDNLYEQQQNIAYDKQKSMEVGDAYNQSVHKKNGGGKLNILVCFLMVVAFGIFGYVLFDIATKGNSKNTTEILGLQKEIICLQKEILNLQMENDSLQSENSSFAEGIDILNVRILELEDDHNKKENLPDDYDYFMFPNEEVYIGQLSQGIPNGIGVVYSSGMVLVGCFQNKMKNGEFYILYDDGHSEIRKYENDILVPETNLPTKEITASNIQADDTEILPITDETAKTYELIYDADVREAANGESSFIISLKKGDTVQSYDNSLTDANGIKWLEITTTTGYNGWVRANQVQEIK